MALKKNWDITLENKIKDVDNWRKHTDFEIKDIEEMMAKDADRKVADAEGKAAKEAEQDLNVLIDDDSSRVETVFVRNVKREAGELTEEAFRELDQEAETIIEI